MNAVSDWTLDPETGRSNSSEKYLEIVAVVEQQIRDLRVGDNTHLAARALVSTLAHKYGFAPMNPENES